jgi:ankyrin repeat protein
MSFNINDPFYIACKFGNLDVINKLIDKINLTVEHNVYIRWAAYKGHLQIVQKLLEHKEVDPSDNDDEAIGVTAEAGHLEVVKLLLNDQRVDPSADNNYAIKCAMLNCHYDIAKLLLNDIRVFKKLDYNEIMMYVGFDEIIKEKFKLESDTDVKRIVAFV